MRKSTLAAATALAIALAAPVLAEEILYLSSGATLPVRSHEVRGDMVYVDLGENGLIAFPMSKVERIEVAGKNVILGPSANAANVMRNTPDTSGSLPVRGSASGAASQDLRVMRAEESRDPAVQTDGSGVGVYRPLYKSSHPGKRQLGAAGHQRVLQGPRGADGSTRIGNRYVIGGVGPRRGAGDTRPPVTGLELRAGGPVGNPPPADSSASAGGDSTGGER